MTHDHEHKWKWTDDGVLQYMACSVCGARNVMGLVWNSLQVRK